MIFTFKEERKRILIYNKKKVYMAYIDYWKGKYHLFTKGYRYYDEKGLLEIINKLKLLNKND